MAITGECFCGVVKYEVSGQLMDATSCHCSQCRKAFNGQGSAFARVKQSEFKWLSGEDNLSLYESTQGYGIQFCKTCGSTLAGTLNGEVFGVTLGCVNGDPEVGEITHIHVASKANWEVMPDGVIQFDQGKPKQDNLDHA